MYVFEMVEVSRMFSLKGKIYERGNIRQREVVRKTIKD